ncbi:MAG: acylphosphatase [Chloroflexi bacterium]|nr:acylphosphatase [Chloroflexota bacterium]
MVGGSRRQIVALAKGRVQGVGYRAFCADTAMRLNVEGFARNLPDGRVEVVAEGDEATLRQFIERLREGPPFARVDDVEFRWEEPTGEYRGFEAVI